VTVGYFSTADRPLCTLCGRNADRQLLVRESITGSFYHEPCFEELAAALIEEVTGQPPA
jgi:hypothetical protein